MHPVAAFLLCVLGAVVLLGSRVGAAAALVAGVFAMTQGQMVVVGPFHFYFLRLLVLFAAARVLIRGELRELRPNKIDLSVLVWVVILFVTSLGHNDPGAKLIFNLGVTFVTALVYIVFRALIRNAEDVFAVGRWLVGCLLVLAAAMVAEQATGHTLWEAFGEVRTDIREGRVRALGPFRHSILAGSVGASLLPFVLALRGRWRVLGTAGVVACLLITAASASSGPIVALAAGLFAVCLWNYREYRRLITWLGVAALLLLQVVMKSNVWYLMARVDLVGGSTGWHRAYLIDQAIAHFGEWWLAGTDFTRHWMPAGVSWSPDHSDITNHYIALGVWGGLALVAAYIATLTLAFKSVGRVLDRQAEASGDQRFLVWSLGSVLFGHTINSLGVFYFDQSVVLIYFVLACISSLDAYPESLSSESTVAIKAPRRRAADGEPGLGGNRRSEAAAKSGERLRRRWKIIRAAGKRSDANGGRLKHARRSN